MYNLTYELLKDADKFKLATTGQRLLDSERLTILRWVQNNSLPKTKLIKQALNHGQTIWNQEQTLLGPNAIKSSEAASLYLSRTHGAHIIPHSSTNDAPFKGVNSAKNIIMQDRVTNVSYGNIPMSEEALKNTIARNKKAAYYANKRIQRPEGYSYAGKQTGKTESRLKMAQESKEQVGNLDKTIKKLKNETKNKLERSNEASSKTLLMDRVTNVLNTAVRQSIITAATTSVLHFVSNALDILTEYVMTDLSTKELKHRFRKLAKESLKMGICAFGVTFILTVVDMIIMAIPGINVIWAIVKAVFAGIAIVALIGTALVIIKKITILIKEYFNKDNPRGFCKQITSYA